MKRILIAMLIIALLLPGASLAAGFTVKPLVTAPPVSNEKEPESVPDAKTPLETAWALVEKADAAYDESEYEACIELAFQAAEVAPDNADVLTSAAMLIYDADYEAAYDSEITEMLQNALKTAFGETRTSAVKLLSRVLSYTEGYEEALALLQEELDRAADFQQLRYRKAELLYFADRYEYALDTLNELLEDSPNNYDAMYLRGMVLYDMYRFDEAVEAYRQLDKSWPDTLDGLYGMYYSYKAAGEFEMASRMIDTLLQSGGEESLWYERASLQLWSLFDPEKALEESHSLIRREPESLDYLGLRVSALLMLERLDEALDGVAKIAPLDEAYATMLRGLILIEQNEWEDASNTYAALVEDAPDYTYAYIQAADVRLDGFSDVEGTKAWLAKGFAMCGSYVPADMYISLGRAYSREGDMLEAARAFTAGDEATYTDPRALHYLALNYADAGRLDGLAETVGAMERKYPGWYDTMAARVLLEDMSGRWPEAVAAFDEMKAKYPFMAANLTLWEGQLHAQAGLEGGAALIQQWIAADAKRETGENWSGYAYALAFENDFTGAEAALAKADAYNTAHMGDPTAAYWVDCVNTEMARAVLKLRQGDSAGCIEALQKAIELGLPASALMLYEQFREIAGTPEFTALYGDLASLNDWDLTVAPTIPK